MAATESLILDALDLNGAGITLESFSNPPAGKRTEWAAGADADGSALVRDPLFDNVEMTFQLRVDVTATMDLALDKLAAISKKIEECEQQPDGLPLVWTPANATRTVTFYVLSGSIDDMPIEANGDAAGWFQQTPVVAVKLTCKPFWYGTEVVGTAVTAGDKTRTTRVVAKARRNDVDTSADDQDRGLADRSGGRRA